MIRFFNQFLSELRRIRDLLTAILAIIQPRIEIFYALVPKSSSSEGSPKMAIDPIQCPLDPANPANSRDVLLTAVPKAGGVEVPGTLSWSVSSGEVLELITNETTLQTLAVSKANGVATVTVTNGAVSNSVEITVFTPVVPIDEIALSGALVPKA